MKPLDPNVARVELVAAALGTLRDKLVFVGGCAVGLLITDKAAAPVRVTLDVDLVVQVAALTAYHKLEAEFQRIGFKRDMTRDAPICRWVFGKTDVDLMPTDPGILGFANRWYPLVIETAQHFTLPSGIVIRLTSAPAFLATKFEAYRDRGNGDVLASHDLEDVINVIDGRAELLDEVTKAPAELRRYLSAQCRALLATANFEDYLPGIVNDGDSPPVRADTVYTRLEAIAADAA